MSRLETVVSYKNTTTSPLGGDSSWVGDADDLSSFQEIDITVAGAPAVAPGTLTFEFSPDGVNWDISVPISLDGPNMIPLPLRVVLPRFRVRYLNGPTPLTAFRLTTLLHRSNSKNLTRFLNQTLSPDTPIEAVRAVIAAQKPDLSYTNVKLTANNEFPVAVANWPAELGGSIQQAQYDLQQSDPLISYIGTAALGAATSDPVWRIKRLTFDVAGNLLNQKWSSATSVWDNRVSEIYT